MVCIGNGGDPALANPSPPNRPDQRIEFYFWYDTTAATGKLMGACGNGTASSEVLLVSGLASTWEGVLEAIFYPGTKVEFYVDGVYKDKIDTNLPAGTDSADDIVDMWIRTGGSAVNRILECSEWMFLQEP